MSRFVSFLMGILVGGAGVYGALAYHFVRDNNGFHAVPKLHATFHETFVDVRGFGAAEWLEHKSLAVAIMTAHRDELFAESAQETVRSGLGGVVDRLRELRD